MTVNYDAAMANTTDAPAVAETHTLTIKCTDQEWASLRALLTAGPDDTEQPMYVRTTEVLLSLLYPPTEEPDSPDQPIPPLTRANSKVGCPLCSCLGGWDGKGGREDGCPLCGHPVHDSATDAV